MASDDPAGLDAAVEAAANVIATAYLEAEYDGDPDLANSHPSVQEACRRFADATASEAVRAAAPHIRWAVLEAAAADVDGSPHECFCNLDDDVACTEKVAQWLRDRAGEGDSDG